MLERLRIFAWPFLLVLNDERYFSSTNASTVLPEYSLPISSKNAVLVSAKSNSNEYQLVVHYVLFHDYYLKQEL